MLGVRMAGLIPNDYGTASEAIDHGKPLTIMAAKNDDRTMVLAGNRSTHCWKWHLAMGQVAKRIEEEDVVLRPISAES